VVGDEDDPCLEPSMFLKQCILTSGLVVFPKTGPRGERGRARGCSHEVVGDFIGPAFRGLDAGPEARPALDSPGLAGRKHVDQPRPGGPAACSVRNKNDLINPAPGPGTAGGRGVAELLAAGLPLVDELAGNRPVKPIKLMGRKLGAVSATTRADMA